MNQSYLAQSVATASPAQLVLMLFDGALARIAAGERGLADGSPQGLLAANRDLTRCQAIVTELQLSLDRKRGGEIAGNLDALYTYCLEQLRLSVKDRDPAPLEICRQVLRELRDAWSQSCCQAPAAV
jgi:flagellar secretion chaperone FliS